MNDVNAARVLNERLRLGANMLQNFALGLVGLAVAKPLVNRETMSSDSIFWCVIALVLVIFAHYMLGFVVKEDAK